jgi:hypothetical protein
MIVDYFKGTIYFAEYINIGLEATSSTKVIHQYAKDGTLLRSFGKPSLVGNTAIGPHYSNLSLTILPNKNILCAFDYPYEIRIFKPTGELIKVIVRDSPLFSKPGLYKRGNFQMLVSDAFIDKCLVFPDGRLLIRIRDHGKNFAQEYKKFTQARSEGQKYELKYTIVYDLFDSQYNFIQSFVDPFDRDIIEQIDSQGYAYVISAFDKIPQVSKYEIDFK